MKNVLKTNIVLGLFLLTLGACGGDDAPYPPYYNGAGTGLACQGNYNQNEMLGVYTGNLGDGAKFVVDIYKQGEAIAAIGDIYIPDVNYFGGINNSMSGNAQAFASCLTSNGYTGTLTSNSGPNAATRTIEIVLAGSGITIHLGGSLHGTGVDSQLSGNNIIGTALIQMNGLSPDIFVLTN